MTTTSPLLSVKELAAELKRTERYVWHMRRRGFRMPGGRATLTGALLWLEANPSPCRKRAGS
jgi:hypothetical protein